MSTLKIGKGEKEQAAVVTAGQMVPVPPISGGDYFHDIHLRYAAHNVHKGSNVTCTGGVSCLLSVRVL